MFKSYLTIALRNFWKHSSFTAINIIGLTLGIACSLFIFLWVQDETSTDQFHAHKEHLYRIMNNAQYGSKEIQTGPVIPYLLAETLENDFSEIEQVIVYTYNQELSFRHEDQILKESGIFASPEFFEVLTFPLHKGDPAQVLSAPSYGAISESLAAKLFGNDWQQRDDLLGHAITFNQDEFFTLMGIFKDVPDNSSLQFDYVLPVKYWLKERPWDESWGNFNYMAIALLNPKTNLTELSKKIAPTLTQHHKYLQENSSIKIDILLYPFQNLHLYGEFENGKPAGGRIEYVRIFTVVAIFVLLLACINFMNLATAKSSKRAREIGVRKAVGASKYALISQFLGESFLLTGIAALLALAVAYVLLPVFNSITDKDIVIPFEHLTFWMLLAGIIILTALLAGTYPAFFLSSFKTTSIFRGDVKFGYKGVMIRKGLVLFQFVLSLLMIIATLVVHWQTHYLKSKALGLDKEHVFSVSMSGIKGDQYAIVKQQLLQKEGIVQVSFVDQNPITIYSNTSDPNWEGMRPDDRISFRVITTDTDFLQTMKIPIVQGRNFDQAATTDTVNYLVNETAVRMMGMENPIGKTLEFWGQKGQIVGVVKDFHLQSLHTLIDPLIIRYHPEDTWMALIKTEAGKSQQAIAGVQDLFHQYKPDHLFEYHFLDDTYHRLYENETTIGHLANAFALIAIVIACLGLIGLAAYAAARRTKEIGIRKVLGASVGNILWLLSQDFMRLILIALLIAIPIANYFLSEWLQGYAYHIPLSWWLFALPGIGIAIIASMVVSGQSFRTARQNPADSLKYE